MDLAQLTWYLEGLWSGEEYLQQTSHLQEKADHKQTGHWLKGNIQKLYKLTAHLAGINTDNPLLPGDNDESLTNHFADYFIWKTDHIHEKFIGIPAFVPEVMDTPTVKKYCSSYAMSGHQAYSWHANQMLWVRTHTHTCIKINASRSHLHNNSHHQHLIQPCLPLWRVEGLNSKTTPKKRK